MTIRERTVAVVGCGLAGMRAAERLQAAGWQVTLFDKSAGTGGRMASSRIGEASADLGAPGIQTEEMGFAQWLEALGAVSWSPGRANFALESLKADPVWVGVPRSSAVTRALVGGAQLRTQTRVGVVWPDREGVLLRDVEGEALGHFDAVVIATPAPQAVPLLDAVHRFQQRAENVETAPIWSVLLELPEPLTALARFHWLEGEHPVLARAVRDSAKPGRQDGEVWMLQASEAWSELHVDDDPASVGEALIEAFGSVLGVAVHPRHQRVHRWLYGRSQPEPGKPASLWDADSGIGVCGDWLTGGDAQGAWESANHLVDRMLEPDIKVA
ncbi:MAG: hypothetical protein CMI01_10255 [Oceanospirillaceae bacterium]|uniref:NAD(P)/FAD-dependent oxidoreductase n=1 Tax=Marinobacterium litorale TaxID=404770 RepID=UPI00041F7A75|nr:FAD-dependent oxidoreductase [Marinobacterium litorale]MBS99047.1 hypothetical protein [Oceanospirillaceae bacterium]